MDAENEFKVEVVDGKIKTTQTVIKTMEVGEAVLDQQQLHGQMKQQEQQKQQLEKQIEEDMFKKNLETLSKQNDRLLKFNQDYVQALTPLNQELLTEMKKVVIAEKAKRGYSRIDVKDSNGKIMAQNQILAPLATSHKLDMNHPLIMSLKQEFDKL